MAPPTPARSAALATLRAVRGGALADHALDAAARSLDGRDRAFLLELVYGTLRLRGRLDHILAALCQRPLDRIDPEILEILRLGAYQVLEMGGVPAYAAISESVELARRAPRGRGAAGFVNGVLRSLRRAASHPAMPRPWSFPTFDADPVGYLSTWGSHPRWLVERWVARYGAPAARALVEANNLTPALYLRLLGESAAARQALETAGVPMRAVPLAGRAVEIDGSHLRHALEHAPVIVQDPAAGLVADFADVPAGALVIDLAAAPGGKAIALATDRREAGPRFVAAADLSLARTRRLADNVARLRREPPRGLGSLPIGLVVADARRPAFGPGDVVLLDAPCTGTGTLRRHPDGRWRLAPSDLGALAGLQADLLDAAAGLVAPGGVLLYATCSLEPEENEDQVHSFLLRHTTFALEPGRAVGPDLMDADGRLRVLPQRHGVDGAFAARLRRRH